MLKVYFDDAISRLVMIYIHWVLHIEIKFQIQLNSSYESRP